MTISTGAVGATHTLQPGDQVEITGVPVPEYNGIWTVETVPSSRSFTFTHPTATGLARTGGGNIRLLAPGASAVGTTATIRTVLAHGRSVGDIVTITTGGGFAGTFPITAVPTPRSFQYELPAAPTTNPTGGGSVTYFSPFRMRFGGNDSALVGGSAQPYSSATVQDALNAIPGFPGATVVAATTGFTISFNPPAAGDPLDHPNVELVDLSCGGCFASVEETNHGGAFDSFKLNVGGTPTATITNGGNYTAAGIDAEIEAITGVGTVAVAGFGNNPFNNTGFQVTFNGPGVAMTNVAPLALQDFSAGATGWVGETDKGGPVDNKGTVTMTGNDFPAISFPAASDPVTGQPTTSFTIPLRTPFALTGAATDPQGDTILYAWEQNDRGGTAGTALLNNVKTNGPLFAMFPKSAPISEADTLLYNSPNQNHVTTSPTRVFPDLQQILDNNTNADTGACPQGPIDPPVPIPVRECFMEFLPTADYVGFAGVNLGPPPELHFRFTARDLRMGGGGNNARDLTLKLAPNTGPFLVTAPNTALTYPGGSSQTVTWDKANTDLPPVGTTDVKISLSTDGGLTYPHVLAASTPNDGSEAVTIPHFATSSARVKIEALGNVFFDVSNANFTITDTLKPTITASVAPPPNAAGWHNSNVTVTLTATDDANGSGIRSITYSATGAQPIPSTTVNAATTSVVINVNGITTLSYFATDNEGNTSDVGTTTIRLDKVAPEAYLRFDPVKRDIAVFGRDGLSGTAAGALTPSRVQRVPTGDRNHRVEIRTFDLVDVAGNTLQLVHSVGLMKNDAVAGIQTLQYNGGAVTRPPYNVMFFDWKLKQNALDELHQEFLVLSPLQRATADWRAKDNRTLVWSLAGGQTTVPGLFLLRLATSNGALSIETTP